MELCTWTAAYISLLYIGQDKTALLLGRAMPAFLTPCACFFSSVQARAHGTRTRGPLLVIRTFTSAGWSYPKCASFCWLLNKRILCVVFLPTNNHALWSNSPIGRLGSYKYSLCRVQIGYKKLRNATFNSQTRHLFSIILVSPRLCLVSAR